MKSNKLIEDIKDIAINTTLSVSLVVMGYYTLHSKQPLNLLPYQIALSFMLISCIWLYKTKDDLRGFIRDCIKDFFVLIISTTVMLMISKELDMDSMKSQLGSLFHLIIIPLEFCYISRMKKLVGERAYIHSTISIIILTIMLCLRLNVYFSVVTSLLVLEPFNYMVFKKRTLIQRNALQKSTNQ